MWFLAQGRLKTGSCLHKIGIIQRDEALCPFCKIEEETMEHLFLTCQISWEIWSHMFNWWGVTTDPNSNPIENISCWKSHVARKFKKQLWCLLFFVIVWSIWSERNCMEFQSKTFMMGTFLYAIKVRLGKWIQYYAPRFLYTPLQVVDNIKAI